MPTWKIALDPAVVILSVISDTFHSQHKHATLSPSVISVFSDAIRLGLGGLLRCWVGLRLVHALRGLRSLHVPRAARAVGVGLLAAGI